MAPSCRNRIPGRSLQTLFLPPRKLPFLRIRMLCCVTVIGTKVVFYFYFLIILKIYLLWHTNAIWTVQGVSKLRYYNLEKWSTGLNSRWKGAATWSGPYLKGNDPSVACSPESIFWAVKYLGLSTYSWVWPWRIITFCEETGVTLGRNKARTRK